MFIKWFFEGNDESSSHARRDNFSYGLECTHGLEEVGLDKNRRWEFVAALEKEAAKKALKTRDGKKYKLTLNTANSVKCSANKYQDEKFSLATEERDLQASP
uniref:Uncharacterized protein n=1 Tax=Lotharella oceanica TaxID=641309 RepID=A0A7S2TG64_9EUKA|mmetsp:Transcript_12047/g.23204  ORF Transcript_12047/g.23204 Transcript_12047/m.23204 type:complete len:102 (+) Transcript_12047:130-435(+)